jgi:hypothetical protein
MPVLIATAASFSLFLGHHITLLLARRMVSSLQQEARAGGMWSSWLIERQISRRWVSWATSSGRPVSRLLLSSRYYSR